MGTLSSLTTSLTTPLSFLSNLLGPTEEVNQHGEGDGEVEGGLQGEQEEQEEELTGEEPNESTENPFDLLDIKGNHFVFTKCHFLQQVTKPRGYRGGFHCLRVEGALCFAGGAHGVVVWDLQTKKQVAWLLKRRTEREVGGLRVEAMVVAGPVLFVALVPRRRKCHWQTVPPGGHQPLMQHPEPDGTTAPPEQGLCYIEAWGWKAEGAEEIEGKGGGEAEFLYSLYENEWAPTCLDLRLPSFADKEGHRQLARLGATLESGKSTVWTFRMLQPPPKPSPGPRGCTSSSKPQL